MVKILVDMIPSDIADLENIGRNGKASNGHSQDFKYCLYIAVEEFIKKYGDKNE
ncbi:unnamed protein product [marine sediment metagenome]|uniref:Uncharacterized protein n=1 Tax=marine sediment metagenome TaxID=412755 RepID=X0SG79_9ZZZZ